MPTADPADRLFDDGGPGASAASVWRLSGLAAIHAAAQAALAVALARRSPAALVDLVDAV